MTRYRDRLLVELLIQVTHRITVKAEHRVVDELVEEAREVRGKAGCHAATIYETKGTNGELNRRGIA